MSINRRSFMVSSLALTGATVLGAPAVLGRPSRAWW